MRLFRTFKVLRMGHLDNLELESVDNSEEEVSEEAVADLEAIRG